MRIVEKLQERFPESKIEVVKEQPDFEILKLIIPFSKKTYTIICTSGLSDYQMPVTHKYDGKEHIELCFCAESDWDIENNEGYTWIYDRLEWLANFMLERKTWFGAGHTIPNGKPPMPLSKVFTQDYFYFDDPIVLEKEFAPLVGEDADIHFLFVIPISKVELDYKQKKTMFGFKKKMKRRGLTEVLEDFRIDIVDKDWLRFLRR